MIKWLFRKYKMRNKIKRIEKSVRELTLKMEMKGEINPPNNLIPFGRK